MAPRSTSFARSCIASFATSPVAGSGAARRSPFWTRPRWCTNLLCGCASWAGLTWQTAPNSSPTPHGSCVPQSWTSCGSGGGGGGGGGGGDELHVTLNTDIAESIDGDQVIRINDTGDRGMSERD